MSEFPEALPHGELSEVFPNVFFVTGRFRMGPALAITRNMTVVRQGDELTVINSVRLTQAGEAALDALGKVKHLVRVGAFHGADDPYYADRYRPTYWVPKGLRHARGLEADHVLAPGSTPIEGGDVFLFEHGKQPEAALVLPHAGGTLVPCDAYQHWTSFAGVSLVGKVMMPFLGFGPTVIGKPWLKAMGPGVRADFERLVDQPFVNLAPAHGGVLEKTAKEGLRTAIATRFSS